MEPYADSSKKGKPGWDEWVEAMDFRHALTREEKEQLWEALLNKVEKIDKASKADRTNRGSSRDPGMVCLGSKAMDTHFKIWQSDGRTKFHHLHAFFDPKYQFRNVDPKPITIKEEIYWSNNDEFNQDRLDRITKDPDRYLIVNHQFYSLGPGNRGGFGGRKIQFQRIKGWTVGPDHPKGGTTNLGPIETTTDLWYSGVIPPAWRDRLPDNAVFLDNFDGPTVMY